MPCLRKLHLGIKFNNSGCNKITRTNAFNKCNWSFLHYLRLSNSFMNQKTTTLSNKWIFQDFLLGIKLVNKNSMGEIKIQFIFLLQCGQRRILIRLNCGREIRLLWLQEKGNLKA